MDFGRVTLLLFISVFSFSVFAEELICQPIESKGEGHWPIPEQAFTIDRASKELDNLKTLLDKQILGIDDFESLKHNTYVYVEGYLRKKLIHELEAAESSSVNLAKKQFCEFLKAKAYVMH